jgi:tetratricopeptide (TPR) repeat protein
LRSQSRQRDDIIWVDMNRILRPASAAVVILAALAAGAQTAPSKQQQIDEHARQAQTYLQQKKPNLAIPELQKVIALDPGNVDAQGNLGVLLFFKGDYAGATAPLKAALGVQPGLAKLRMLLGICERRTGDAEAAKTDLEQALPGLSEPTVLVQAGMELVDLYVGDGDLEKAAAVIDRLRQADPGNRQVLYAAYRLYADLAGESLLSLSLVAPESAEMHEAMSRELARQGNTEAAIAQLRKALALNPSLASAHIEIGELLETMPDQPSKDAALPEFEAALKINPQNEKAMSHLGTVWARKGDLQKAYSYYSEAVKLEPSDEDATLGLAKTLISMDQKDKALPLLERAVQLEPTDATAHFRLSNLYRQQGRADDAKREVELYKKYKDMKTKLEAVYKEMRVQQPNQRPADEQDEK